MKSVVDETGNNAASKELNKRRVSNASSSSVVDDSQKAEQERFAVWTLEADVGMTRVQVSATIQSLLIAVQDRVMTQRKLRSANWYANESTILSNNNNDTVRREVFSDLLQEIIEQPV